MIKEEWPLNKCLFTEGLEHNTTRFATPGVHHPSKNCRPTYCRSFQPKHTHTHTHTQGYPSNKAISSQLHESNRNQNSFGLTAVQRCYLAVCCIVLPPVYSYVPTAKVCGVFFVLFFFSFLSVVLFHITLIKPKTAFCMSDSGQQICKRTWSWHSCHWSSNWDLIFLFFFLPFLTLIFYWGSWCLYTRLATLLTVSRSDRSLQTG